MDFGFGCITVLIVADVLKISIEQTYECGRTMLLVAGGIFGEAFSIAIFGTTWGKAFYKLQVRTSTGGMLNFTQSQKRSWLIFFRGLGFGFIFLTFFTALIAYGNLDKEGATTWDRDGGFVVTAQPLNWRRALIGFCLSIFIIISFYAHLNT